LIAASLDREFDRNELQALGQSASFQGPDWLVKAVRQTIDRSPGGRVIVIDAIRTLEQLVGLKNAAAGRWRILHVHLAGDARLLARRHSGRRDGGPAWDQAMRSPTEAAVWSLQAEADIVIDTTCATPADVAARVGARIRSAQATSSGYADVLVGGQWGSEGKGNLAFYVAPEYDLLIRVGAPNAGHKVLGHDGAVYTHRQLPSGTKATDSRILLGAGAVIDLAILMREIADCAIGPDRLAIDPSALLIEEHDAEREAGLKHAIGSTGTGGGAALARRIEQRGTTGAVRMARDMPELSPYIHESASVLEDVQALGGRIFIEGTQGTGLSILHGSYPHVTSRDTTVGTLLAEAGVAPCLLRRVIVAFRTYPIRVGGRSGPMGREIDWDTVAQRSGVPGELVRGAEVGSVSGNPRRVAEFSWAQLWRSVRLNGPTDIALTFADYLDVRNKGARRLSQLTRETIGFIEEVEAVARAPVSLISTGFDGRPIDRRLW
jgi:adenylosuccinate synthase